MSLAHLFKPPVVRLPVSARLVRKMEEDSEFDRVRREKEVYLARKARQRAEKNAAKQAAAEKKAEKPKKKARQRVRYADLPLEEKERLRERARLRYEQKKQLILERNREWRARNAEKLRAKRRERMSRRRM